MSKLVTLTLTDGEAIDMRLALNAASTEWGVKAEAARKLGDHNGAGTCERIRASYGALWEKVAAAQHDCCEFHASGGSRAFSCGGDAITAPDAHIADNFASHYESSNMQRP
jgi:hypothetical protein